MPCRPLAELADLLTRELAEHGPLPLSAACERIGLTDTESRRLTAALDRHQIPGLYKCRRARKPRVIVGIEGDSRRWLG